MFIVIAVIAYWVMRFVVEGVVPNLAPRDAKPAEETPEIPAVSEDALPLFEAAEDEARVPVPEPEAPAALPEPLCYRCLYAHIVRGFGAGEELIACGYVFPMREVCYRVRECSDYRPKRERNRVEIASEGAVCILPLDEMAADFHAVAATRNGKGGVKSSYD